MCIFVPVFNESFIMCRWVKINVLFIAVLTILVARNVSYAVVFENGTASFLSSDVTGRQCYPPFGEEQRGTNDVASKCCADLFHYDPVNHGNSSSDCKSVLRSSFASSGRYAHSYSFSFQNLNHSTHPYLTDIVDYYVYTLGHILI